MSGTDYGILSRALHHVTLGSRLVSEASFDLEQAIYDFDTSQLADQKHVFVVGLARSGSTILMRRFYSSGMYRSLTYRDMPFVLMPNLWKKISSTSHKQAEKKERLHGDGVLMDFDSPEAFEEVFWRVFDGDNYIRKDKLVPSSPDQETLNKFQAYVSAILASSGGSPDVRYLSKNNNNILRLASIGQMFPNALIVIPCRSPVDQAFSLLRVHRKIVEDQRQDAFTWKYMNWLVHHEFGLRHIPFRFGKDKARYGDPMDINYWLEVWIGAYSWLYENRIQSTVFLNYEKFCDDVDGVWSRICDIAGIPVETFGAADIEPRRRNFEGSVDGALMKTAEALYAKILPISL